MNLLRVGLTMRIVENTEYIDPRDAISQDWINLMISLNYLPVLIPNNSNWNSELFSRLNLDALILTNGDETKIGYKGQTNEACDKRDFTEIFAFNYCKDKELPILGVCRGMQFIFRFYGGKLNAIDDKSHTNTLQEVTFIDGTKRHVNSYHDFTCSNDHLPDELVVWARSPEGYIEALKHKSRKILGFQWHPEREHPSTEEDILIIRNFFEG